MTIYNLYIRNIILNRAHLKMVSNKMIHPKNLSKRQLIIIHTKLILGNFNEQFSLNIFKLKLNINNIVG
jgi:hypothetical protein